MVEELNGWQKLDKTVDCMKDGNVKCVEETLKTVGDQKLFMDLLGSKTERANLPGLQIVDGDKDGHTDAVKVTAGKNKMTVSLADGKLSVTDDNVATMKAAGNAIETAAVKVYDSTIGPTVDAGIKKFKEFVNGSPPVEDISRAGTNDSNLNRYLNDKIKRGGA